MLNEQSTVYTLTSHKLCGRTTGVPYVRGTIARMPNMYYNGVLSRTNVKLAPGTVISYIT